MKNLSLLVATIFVSLANQAWAIDGCYQMYDTGVLYPAFCIAGSAEEGIGGAGIRIAMVEGGTTQVFWCGTTRAASVDENGTWTLELDSEEGVQSIAMEKLDESNQGKLTLREKTRSQVLKYGRLSKESQGLLGKVFESELCD